MNVGDPVSIRRAAIPKDFAVYLSPTRLGVFVLLQDDHRSSFAEHESVAQTVKGTRCTCRIVIVRGKCRQQTEARQSELVDHAVRTTSNHGVNRATTNKLSRLANCLTTGRTCGQAIQVGATDIKHRRNLSTRHAGFLLKLQLWIKDLEAGSHEGVDVYFIAFSSRRNHASEVGKVLIAFTSAEVEPDAIAVDAVEYARILNSLLGRAGSEFGMPTALFPHFGVFTAVGNVPAFDFGRNLGRILRSVEDGNVAHATATVDQRVPNGGYIEPKWIDHPHSGDNDPTTHASQLLGLAEQQLG